MYECLIPSLYHTPLHIIGEVREMREKLQKYGAKKLLKSLIPSLPSLPITMLPLGKFLSKYVEYHIL